MHGKDKESLPNIGNIKRKKLFGIVLYVSPDLCMWIAPTSITLGLGFGAYFAAGHIPRNTWPYVEIPIFWLLVITALVCSALCGLTDPGIIPKPTIEDPDPYVAEGRENRWRFCDWCKLYRPPRASHCHVCKCCVLQHDHHCGVVGGDVGLRSLRWFTTYLVCIGVASCMAESWLVRSMIAGEPTNTTLAALAPPLRGQNWRQRPSSVHSPFMAYHIGLLIGVGNIILMVGGLACYYIFLVCTDQTRREAKGRASGGAYITGMWYHEDHANGLQRSWQWRWLGNFGRVFFPPPSLIEEFTQRPQAEHPREAYVEEVALVDTSPSN